MSTDITTPEWVKHAVFYQIFPDRFARSASGTKPNNLEAWEDPPTNYGFKGGDLLGVVEKLDYLQDLGISAIYFNPIFQSAANHRYHTHDYFQIDPLLGGDAAFRTLLAAAHERDIRIVLDGVFNHASRGFFQFNHILENGDSSPYVDWFHVYGYPLNAYGEEKPNYRAWWNLQALPKFDTSNPQVQNFIMEIGRYWIQQGIDGWRLDVPEEIYDDGFWQTFRQVVKAANPEAYIVGEIWNDAHRWLQGDQFDAVMNYPLSYASLAFFGGHHVDAEQTHENARPHLNPLDAPGFATRVNDMLTIYARPVTEVQLNLLDSHDTPRFLTSVRGNLEALKLATLFQMTFPGAPCVYYGDEIGMEGGFDPDCRRSFPWEVAHWNAGLRDYFKDCIALRNSHPALRTGDFIALFAVDMVYAYLRKLESDVLLIVINAGEQAAQIDLPLQDHLSRGVALQTVLGPGEARLEVSHTAGLHIPARSGIVFKAD